MKCVAIWAGNISSLIKRLFDVMTYKEQKGFKSKMIYEVDQRRFTSFRKLSCVSISTTIWMSTDLDACISYASMALSAKCICIVHHFVSYSNFVVPAEQYLR